MSLYITIDGWEYRDGALSEDGKRDNQRHFAYCRQKMQQGMTEKEADAAYEAEFPPPRAGQAPCRACGKWTCDNVHEEEISDAR